MTSSLLIITMASTIAGSDSRQSVTTPTTRSVRTAPVAGDDADQAADRRGRSTRGTDADEQRGAGAVDALREHVVAELVGAEQRLPRRAEGVAVGDLAVHHDLLGVRRDEPQGVAEHGARDEHDEVRDATRAEAHAPVAGCAGRRTAEACSLVHHHAVPRATDAGAQ